MKALKIDEKDNVATPITSPYFITLSPLLISVRAILWPIGIRELTFISISSGLFSPIILTMEFGTMSNNAVATEYIKKGDWVHTHNLDSVRGKINGK